MVGKNRLQLAEILRLEEIFHRAVRQLCKRFVGRREHRQRSFAFERIDQSRRLYCGNQGLERSGRHRSIDYIFFRLPFLLSPLRPDPNPQLITIAPNAALKILISLSSLLFFICEPS